MVFELIYHPGELIQNDLFGIKILSIIDLCLTSTIIFLQYCLWSNISVFYAFITLFQTLHAFSWMGGLTLSTTVLDVAYSMTVLVIYTMCLFPDFGSLVWRIILIIIIDPTRPDIKFIYASMILNLVLVVIDFLMIWFIGSLLNKVTEYVDNIGLGFSNSVKNQKKLEIVKKNPEDLYFSRIVIVFVATAELIMFGTIAFISLVGLNISSTFSYLVAAQAPHSYLWLGLIGIAKGVNDRAFLLLFTIAYVACFFLDIGSTVWRVIAIVNCYSFGTTSTCGWITPFSWIASACSLGLGICSFINAYSCWTIQEEITREYNRLSQVVPERLYPLN